MMRIRILKGYLWLLGVFALFWWIFSHWLYPGWYHELLGFEGYVDSFVKVIGTLSVLPTLGLFFTAANPLRNRDFCLSLIILSVLMAGTYVLLMTSGDFPKGEILNTGLLLANSLILMLLYPWKQANAYLLTEEVH